MSLYGPPNVYTVPINGVFTQLTGPTLFQPPAGYTWILTDIDCLPNLSAIAWDVSFADGFEGDGVVNFGALVQTTYTTFSWRGRWALNPPTDERPGGLYVNVTGTSFVNLQVTGYQLVLP